jgi:hypothetical protein
MMFARIAVSGVARCAGGVELKIVRGCDMGTSNVEEKWKPKIAQSNEKHAQRK